MSSTFKENMLRCARPNCQLLAKNRCSSCARELYCGSTCQKLDWKLHKSLCPILKKLLNKPFDAYQIILDILASQKGFNIRILEHLILYAEFQFGYVLGEGCHEFVDGGITSNWNIELNILQTIYKRATDTYSFDDLSSFSGGDNKKFSYLQRSLILLNPWLIHHDSEENRLNDYQINHLLQQLYCTEVTMAVITMNSSRLVESEGHCQRSLSYTKRFLVEDKDKTTSIFTALRNFVELRERQEDHSGALIFAEEMYNLVVEVYDPVHIQVQVC